MAYIILFTENRDRKCVIRFVKGFRRKGFFRKERVEYTIVSSEAFHFYSTDQIPDFVMSVIRKDYPDADIKAVESEGFNETYSLQRFFAIACFNEGYNEEYYNGNDAKGKTTFTSDLSDVRMILSESSAKETLRTIQQTTGDRVFIRTLYLNLVNELLTPVFMITCTSKGNRQTKYFKMMDGNRIRLVTTSEFASRFTYEEVLKEFDYLQTHNKNFLYAVLPVFKDNVNAKDIGNYMRDNKISRMVAMDLKLRFLNR